MKAKFVYESTSDYLKPKEEGLFLNDVKNTIEKIYNDPSPNSVFRNSVFVGFNSHQKLFILWSFKNGKTPKETAFKILDNILDGVYNFKFESAGDFLKPKSEEDIRNSFKEMPNNKKFLELRLDKIKLIPTSSPSLMDKINDLKGILTKTDYWKLIDAYCDATEKENNFIFWDAVNNIIKQLNESIGDFLKPKSNDEVESAFNNLHSPQHKFNVAVQKGFLDKVKELLTNPKYSILDVNPNHMTGLAISTAVENGNYEMVELLLSDKRVRDYAKEKLNYLLMVQAVNNIRMIDILRKHGIDSTKFKTKAKK